MVISILFIFLVASLILTVYRTLRRRLGRTFDELLPYLRPVNLEELRELLNIAQEGYLRLNLSATEFRRSQLNRLHLSRELLSRMSHNASFLQVWASVELARSWKTLNRGAKHASRELSGHCGAFRVAVLIVQLRLTLWSLRITLLPFIPIPCLAGARSICGTDLLYTYERIKAAADKLGCSCGGHYQRKLEQIL
jgi:hypothetical protein